MKTMPRPDTGSPKTLEEALWNGMLEGARREPQVQNWKLRAHVLDFLAQKFGAAMMAADEKTLDVLQALWVEIGKKEKEE